MISGALEINTDHFVNWNKVLRIDFHEKDGKRQVLATFGPDNVINYGEISKDHEEFVKRQLRGESERENSAGF